MWAKRRKKQQHSYYNRGLYLFIVTLPTPEKSIQQHLSRYFSNIHWKFQSLNFITVHFPRVHSRGGIVLQSRVRKEVIESEYSRVWCKSLKITPVQIWRMPGFKLDLFESIRAVALPAAACSILKEQRIILPSSKVLCVKGVYLQLHRRACRTNASFYQNVTCLKGM